MSRGGGFCLDLRRPTRRGSAPGYRGNGEGALGSIGSIGCNWSSPSYDSGDRYRGMCLNFHVATLDPGSAGNRAYGFQLRCLSE